MALGEFVGLMLTGLWKVFIYGPYDTPEMLYILVPVYIGWFVNDYYQERRGTHLGNAASNGFLALWVGIDWIRTMFSRLNIGKITLLVSFKIFIALAMLAYGLFIMKLAIQGNKLASKIGRVREVSYFLIVFTPFIYSPSLIRPNETVPTIVGILLFFVIFYFTVEYIITEVLPAPKTEKVEIRDHVVTAHHRHKTAKHTQKLPTKQKTAPRPSKPSSIPK